jgi:serine/threonine-protein kinase
MPVAARAQPRGELGSDTTPEPMDLLWQGGPAPVTHHTTALERPGPAEPLEPPPPPVPPSGRGRRNRRPLLLLLVGILAAALVAGGAYWYGWARYTTTPSVLGLSKAAAEKKLDDAGLQVEYADAAYSESVKKGDVISSDPGAGARILPDDAVTLTLSLGPERYDLPKLAGLTVPEAEAELEPVKMVIGRTTEVWSETVHEGRIIRTDPAYGTKDARNLPVDTAVDVVVSKGRRPIRVTDFTGRSADRAVQVLEGRGLDVTTDEEYSEDVDKGDVISQDPTDGTLYKGDEVKLVVSQGPPLVEVPEVRYESTDDAVAELEGLGFDVQVEHAEIYLTGSTAWSTNPASGEMVVKGSTITLYVV